jgi:hypothetical protein
MTDVNTVAIRHGTVTAGHQKPHGGSLTRLNQKHVWKNCVTNFTELENKP